MAARPGVALRALAVVAVAGLVVVACSGTPAPPEDPGAVPGPPPVPSPPPSPPPEPPLDPDPPLDPEPPPDPPAPEPLLGAYGVSAGDEAAVDAGMAILAAGGNAVDAAIAAAFAVGVVEPFASGIGGGGAALVARVGGDVDAYDYREVVNQDGTIPRSSTGIPGLVRGMQALHDDHGVLPWEDLLAPAIELAEDGVATSQLVANQLQTGAARLDVRALDAFFPGGGALRAGDRLVQPELAATLRVLAEDGPDALYTGSLAEALDAQVAGVDLASLAAYEVQRSTPVRGTFAGLEVVAASPPLPGAALIQQLQVAEALDVASLSPSDATSIHRMMMAWRIADRSVSEHLGDPDFVDVPVAQLTDLEANAALADTVSDTTLLAVAPSTPAPAAGGPTVLATALEAGTDVGNTTHLTVVDADGTMVSMTNTLTNFWGSGQHVAGFFLNDQLSRFSIGGDANRPAPGRRSVSWSLPVVVLDEQARPVLGIGSPGGRRIPNIEAGVLVRWALHGESLQDAVEARRVHLEGSTLQLESLPGDAVASELRSRGYTLEVPAPVYYFGSVQALEVDHDAGTVTGAQDPRRAGTWRSADLP